jgi:FtsP/CotA-like multicopper oxidase with cupredoxin domain
MAAGYTSAIPASLLYSHTSRADILAAGLSDPAMQPLFVNLAPNAMDDNFKYAPSRDRLKIVMAQARQMTGLVGADGVTPVPTTIWGYGTRSRNVTWPGMTIERHVNDAPLKIVWENLLFDRRDRPLPHLLPVDNSLHWCYSLHGYQQYSIAKNGVPVVPHVHGGKNDSPFDGNPEFFFSPGSEIRGPRFVEDAYKFGGRNWNDAAGMMWYHDHALGITRLNVYAGLAGFFALRDDNDTGGVNNPAGLPGGPFELGYAVQDRMFKNTGDLFYSAFPGDPFYDDFIDGEGVILPEDRFPDGGPTGLAEFFGDHMVVNGVIWPKTDVEQRQYRVRFLNGTDSRFMRLGLKVIRGGAGSSNPLHTDPSASSETLPFFVVGSDQSLAGMASEVTAVNFLPGERLDLVIDFNSLAPGDRVIVENLLGDSPWDGAEVERTPPGGSDEANIFPGSLTDRVMAFDVNERKIGIADTAVGHNSPVYGGFTNAAPVSRTRKLALFEGKDSVGRLQPLLGTAEEVTDVAGNTVQGAMPWFTPITENPGVGDTEIWEIYNVTGDAHPVHVHLVHFEVLGREAIVWDSNADEEGQIPDGSIPAGDGTFVAMQSVAQHDGSVGIGFRVENPTSDGIDTGTEESETDIRRDMVLAKSGEVTRIKMTFTKPGRYVWHCHILSHEDHEMMRPFHVGPGPF